MKKILYFLLAAILIVSGFSVMPAKTAHAEENPPLAAGMYTVELNEWIYRNYSYTDPYVEPYTHNQAINVAPRALLTSYGNGKYYLTMRVYGYTNWNILKFMSQENYSKLTDGCTYGTDWKAYDGTDMDGYQETADQSGSADVNALWETIAKIQDSDLNSSLDMGCITVELTDLTSFFALGGYHVHYNASGRIQPYLRSQIYSLNIDTISSYRGIMMPSSDTDVYLDMLRYASSTVTPYDTPTNLPSLFTDPISLTTSDYQNYTATCKVSDNADETVTSIQVLNSVSLVEKWPFACYIGMRYGSEYGENIYDTDNKTFSLQFSSSLPLQSLWTGIDVLIKTEEHPEGFRTVLLPSSMNQSKIMTLSDDETGCSYSSQERYIKNKQLEVVTGEKCNEIAVNDIKNIADGDNWKAYSFYLKDDKGNSVYTQKGGVVRAPIPKEWDLDNTYIGIYIKNGKAATSDMAGTATNWDNYAKIVDTDDERYIEYITQNPTWVKDGTIVMCQVLKEADLSTELKEDGTYTAEAKFIKADGEGNLSMANAALDPNVVVEVVDGKKTIYMNLHAIQLMEGVDAYVGAIWNKESSDATVLDYETDEEGKLLDNAGFDAVTEFGCIKRVKINLSDDTMSDNKYVMHVIPPAMASGITYDEAMKDPIPMDLKLYNVKKVDDDSVQINQEQKSVLRRIIDRAKQYDEASYTAESYGYLSMILGMAEKVYNNLDGTDVGGNVNKSLEIANYVIYINDAISKLVENSDLTDARSALAAVINDAKKIEQGNKTDSAFNELQNAISKSESELARTSTTADELKEAKEALEQAVISFRESREISGLDAEKLENGTYTANVTVLKAANPSEKSMAHNALINPVTITVTDDEFSMTCEFQGITIPLGGKDFYGYMKSLSYWDGKSYTPVTVDSEYDILDDFNDIDQDGTADYKYPHQMTFPMINKAKGDDEEGRLRMQVFVPIMESIQAGSGTQEALFKIDWTSLQKLEMEAVNKDTLKDTIDEANKKLEDTSVYTADSVKALQAATATAAEVLKNENATQEDVDKATEDLNKAIEGLTEKVTDRTPLENAIAEAKKVDEKAYTPDSYQKLINEIAASEAVLKKDKVTDDEIAAAVKALDAVTNGLIKRADFSELQKAYDEAAAIENQKQPGWDDLQTALANAKKVLDDANSTQAQVDDQTNAIKNAVANLGEAIDKSALADLIKEAKDLDTSKYSDESVKAFQAAIAAAEKVNDDEDAAQQEIEKQIQMLKDAAEALIQKEEQDVVYDGTYEINGWLWHASADQYSMGNAALANPLQVVVKDGKATLRMEYKPLTTSLGKTEFTGYLARLNYYPDWEGGTTGYAVPDGETPVPVTVESYYEDIYDSYNDPEDGTDKNIKGKLYPHIMNMPVELGDSEIWVQVYVPVMEAINEGSGLQYAKLQLDWSTLKQLSGTETDKSALNTALAQAKTLADSLKEGDPGYAEENVNVLTNAIANAQSVADNMNVDQTAVDAAAKALQTAMNLFNEEPVKADKTELTKAIEVADTYLKDKTSGFSETSLAALQTAIDNAAKVNDDPNATQTQVNAAVTAIDNAIKSLTKDKADKTALADALKKAAGILANSDTYSPAEMNVLQKAYDAAQAVYDDAKASQEDIDAQTGILSTLLNSIVPVTHEKVEKAGLHDVLVTAANMLGRDNTFTFASRHALKKAIRAAEKVYDDPEATQTEVNEAANEVVSAMLDLEMKEGIFSRPDDSQTGDDKTDDQNDGKTDGQSNDKTDGQNDNTGLDIKNLADGVYVVNGNMVKVNKTDASMSDKAINHNIKLTVKDGKYYITMDFNGLTVGNQLGYLGSLKYFETGYTTNQYGAPQGSTKDVTVDSCQTNADGSKVKDNYGTDYPDLVTFELIPEALEDGYVPLQVFVPIMEAISTGSGTQPVYLALDWTSIQEAEDGQTQGDKADDAGKTDDSGKDSRSPAVDLTDPATGVHVTAPAGVLPEGVKLVVTPITEGSDYDKTKANTFVAGNNFRLYDIHFEDAKGNEVEPAGKATVSLPVDQDWDTTRLTVYHFKEDGSTTPIIGTAADGMYTFTTDSFSNYALVERKASSLPGGIDNGSGGSSLNDNTLSPSSLSGNGSGLGNGTASTLSSNGSGLSSAGKALDSVKTGDSNAALAWTFVLATAAAALVLIAAEQKKRDRRSS